MKPILGIDFGRARVGVAISDELHFLAHPLVTIASGKDTIARVAELVRQREVERVVVGMPKSMSGRIGAAAEEVMGFVNQLRKVLSCDVVTWDERLTTVAAHRALRDAGKKSRATRPYVDQVAAQMILQGYLDRQQAARSAEESPP